MVSKKDDKKKLALQQDNQNIESPQEGEAILAEEVSNAEANQILQDTNQIEDPDDEQSSLTVDSNQEEQLSIMDKKQHDDLLQEADSTQDIEQQDDIDSDRQAAWMYMVEQSKKLLDNKQALNHIEKASTLLFGSLPVAAVKLLKNPIIADKTIDSMEYIKKVNDSFLDTLQENSDQTQNKNPNLSEDADSLEASRKTSDQIQRMKEIAKKFNEMDLLELDEYDNNITANGREMMARILIGENLLGCLGGNSYHPIDSLLYGGVHFSIGMAGVFNELYGYTGGMLEEQLVKLMYPDRKDYQGLYYILNRQLGRGSKATTDVVSHYKGTDRVNEIANDPNGGFFASLGYMLTDDPWSIPFYMVENLPAALFSGKIGNAEVVKSVSAKTAQWLNVGRLAKHVPTSLGRLSEPLKKSILEKGTGYTQGVINRVISDGPTSVINNWGHAIVDAYEQANGDDKLASHYVKMAALAQFGTTAMTSLLPLLKGDNRVGRSIASASNRLADISKDVFSNKLMASSHDSSSMTIKSSETKAPLSKKEIAENIDKTISYYSSKINNIFKNISEAPITKRHPEAAKLVFNTLTPKVYIGAQVLADTLEEAGVEFTVFLKNVLGGAEHFQEALLTGQDIGINLGSLAVGLSKEKIHYSKVINHLSDSATSFSINDLKENFDGLKTHLQNMPQHINSMFEQVSENKAVYDSVFGLYKNSGLDDKTSHTNARNSHVLIGTLANSFGQSIKSLIDYGSLGDTLHPSLPFHKSGSIVSTLLGTTQKGFLQKDPKTGLLTINTTRKVGMDGVINDSSILFFEGYNIAINNGKVPDVLIENNKVLCEFLDTDNISNVSPDQLKKLNSEFSYFFKEGKAKDPRLTEVLIQYQDFALDLYQNTKDSGVKFSKEVSVQLEPLLISRNMVDDAIGSSSALFPVSSENQLRASEDRQQAIKTLSDGFELLEKENLTQRQEHYRELKQKPLPKNKEEAYKELYNQQQTFNLSQLLDNQRQLELKANVLAVSGYKLNLVKTDMSELTRLQLKEQGYTGGGLDMMATLYSAGQSDYFYSAKAKEMLEGKDITIEQRNLYLANAEKANHDARKAFENKEFDKVAEAKKRERLNYTLFLEAVPILEQNQQIQKVVNQMKKGVDNIVHNFGN